MEAESVLTQVHLIRRYDEWVKADRIIWPVEKGSKKRQRKKVKVSSVWSCDRMHAGLKSCDVTSSRLSDQILTSFTLQSAAGRQRVGGVSVTH